MNYLNSHIGGFFEIEKLSPTPDYYHHDARFIACARASLRIILEFLKVKHIWVPFYICDSVLASIKDCQIGMSFYQINKDFTINSIPELGENEYLLVVNYFGIQGKYIDRLKKVIGNQLIIDNTQAFFRRNEGEGFFSFNSCRKFFGVPDGSWLYGPEIDFPELSINMRHSTLHLELRSIGRQREAFELYQDSEKKFTTEPLQGSLLSFIMLGQLDYMNIINKRIDNFRRYSDALGSINQINPTIEEGDVPFFYPFMPKKTIDKFKLVDNFIYIPTFWPEVLLREVNGFEFERKIAADLLPLPIDHRYDKKEIDLVISEIFKQLGLDE
ncbi:MAG: hypothetical protein HUU45_09495 [Leptospiraceae bacterium]|nr:hypothetical protein [Leptospiraceae bacterium]